MRQLFYLIAIFTLTLSSCSSWYEITTKLNDDGSLERTIICGSGEDAMPKESVFGILDEKWRYKFFEKDSLKDLSSRDKLSRKFSSIDEINAIMNQDSDTLWQIETNIDSRFKWFFTYHEVSETYSAIDRLRFVDQKDFFTKEDYQFIDRIKSIDRIMSDSLPSADSLYAKILGGKIIEYYYYSSWRAEWRKALNDLFVEKSLHNWVDSLDMILIKIGELGDDQVVKLLLELDVPMDSILMSNRIKENMKETNSRQRFMDKNYDLTLTHSMELPGAVIRSNAHSIQGNKATWYPQSITYILTPFRMHATYRTLNWWAIILSGLFVLATLWWFYIKK